MITEDSQSESLGRWLDGDDAYPADVDSDVLEAVYALRPELAPTPKTSIEEILGHLAQAEATQRLVDGEPAEGVDSDVQEGLFALRPDLAPAPTTSIEEILAHLDEADAARRLVDGEQVAVDADVRDAIFALRPERAPAPNATIDDILAKVNSGPLAAPGAQVIAFPGGGGHNKPIVPANKPARSWTRVIAGSGAIGLFAVAAAAALLVLPNLSMLKGPSMPDGAGPMPTMSAPMSPAPRPAPTIPMGEKVAVDGSATDATKALDSLDLPVSKPSDRAAAEPMPIAEVAAAMPPVESRPAPDLDDALVDGFESEDAKKEASEQYWSQPADAPTDGLFGGEVATGSGAAGVASSDNGVADKERQTKPRVTRGASASNMADPAPPMVSAPPPPAAPAKTDAKAPTTSTTTAAPATINDFSALEAQAKSHASAGRYGDAARTLLPAIAQPREDGQRYAAMAAGWFLDANDVAAARDAVDRGLALGTPVRGELSRVAAAVSRAEQPATTAPAATQQ